GKAEEAERRPLLAAVSILIVVVVALALTLRAEAEHEGRAALAGVGGAGGAYLALDIDGDHSRGHPLDDVGERHGRAGQSGRGCGGPRRVDRPAFGAGAGVVAAGAGQHEGAERGGG